MASRIIKQPPLKEKRKTKSSARGLVSKNNSKKQKTKKPIVIKPDNSGLRVTNSGLVKRIQFSSQFKKFLEKNPNVLKDFLDLYGKARVFGFAKKGAISIRNFDPKDKSRFHDSLFKVSFKGKQSFFIKIIKNAYYPIDSVTQYTLHNSLKLVEPNLKKWGCKILPYVFAYNGKNESILVAPFKEGIILEKWLNQNSLNKKNGVYQRFLKIERFLKSSFNVHDLTTNNVIYNPKKDELIIIDLMPGKKKK